MNEYQRAAASLGVYPREHAVVYPAIGLAGEAGEVANKVKKTLRGDGPAPQHAIGAEIGDVLWYCAALAADLGLTLDDIAAQNLEKLRRRKEDGTLKGDGDSR